MDLIRNILSHFRKDKTNKQNPLSINGLTIQQVNNNLQQDSETEPNNEEWIEIEVPPLKKFKKNELKKGDIPDNNISDVGIPFDDSQTTISVINNANNTIIDLTDNANSYGVEKILEIDEKAEISNISLTRVPSNDKQTADLVNNDNIELQNDKDKDTTIPEDIITSDVNETAVLLNNNGFDGVNNSNTNNLQNTLKFGDNTEKSDAVTQNITGSHDKQTLDFIDSNSNNKTIDNTDNSNCNKLLNPQNQPDAVANILTENIDNELALIIANIEDTTTKCIREFEDILANVENELTLDSEITLDDVNDLINDFTFDSVGEIYLSDSESQIPIHIVRNNVEKHIPTDIIDYTYDITVETVDPHKPIEFPVVINNNTETDAKINTTANNYNTKLTDINDNTIENNGNSNPDIIDTINENTNAETGCTNKTEELDTISISSDDNTVKTDIICIRDSSDSDCGYHSSDFEFITEEEAKRDGLIINFKPDNFKNKVFKGRPVSTQPKIRKMTSKGKTIRARPSNPVKRPSNIQARPRNPVQRHLKVQTRPSNLVPTPLNVQARLSNSVPIPSNSQVTPSNPISIPSNIQTIPSNLVPIPSSVQAGPSNLVPMPSNIQAGPSNPVPTASTVQARLSNHVPILSNFQAGSNNLVPIPLNVQEGPSNLVPMTSPVQAGPSNAVPVPSNVHVGPSNPVPIPSNVQARPSNPVPTPSIVQAGPSKAVPRPSIVQAGPNKAVPRPSNIELIQNYESYRNKYKKQFKYDTSYRNNHLEPQGDGYMDLFRGFHAGLYPMYTRENKSLTPNFASTNRMWFQGVGFDMHMMRESSSDDEDDGIKHEAHETFKKIRTEYPIENRKRRH